MPVNGGARQSRKTDERPARGGVRGPLRGVLPPRHAAPRRPLVRRGGGAGSLPALLLLVVAAPPTGPGPVLRSGGGRQPVPKPASAAGPRGGDQPGPLA